MSDVLRETLARAARAVPAPAPDLEAVISGGERTLRRRRWGAVVATAVVVALATAAPSVWGALGDGPHTIDRPGPVTPVPRDEDPGGWSRPLVWAEGPHLHVGNRQVDIGFIPRGWNGDTHGESEGSLSVLRSTDDGAVFATLDGRIFFSDGRSVERIGKVPGPRIRPRSVTYISGRPESWIMTDPSGSRVAWIEAPNTQTPEIVVYDTAKRQARRVPVGLLAGKELVGEPQLLGEYVYWEQQVVDHGSSGPVWRTELSTGRSERTDRATAEAQRARLGPALLVGERRITVRDAAFGFSSLPAVFVVQGSQLRAAAAPEPAQDGPPAFVPIRDPRSGEELHFTAPEKMREAGDLVMFAWLDPDRFALSATPDWDRELRDIIVCRISTQSCRIAAHIGTGPYLVLPWAQIPG